ncbi:DUF4761 family protein [Buttiauxella sp. 3AFRM03]|uniref:DUF4761 family protein n=1 Tax=Buttiauxella sp. 3AFRM03 TaxID=2479367 RepID=UPI000EF837FB|nr:DUF4761 family protein [Buttiauxella sp. 3AFRM03]AYN26566.1 DUF4761 family protein [Buttiauxella sp. 3AFRM03]
MSQIVEVDSHTFIYRGFTINKCPRNSLTLKTPYRVLNNGDYYGRDFALAEAVATINKIYGGGFNNETSVC